MNSTMTIQVPYHATQVWDEIQSVILTKKVGASWAELVLNCNEALQEARRVQGWFHVVRDGDSDSSRPTSGDRFVFPHHGSPGVGLRPHRHLRPPDRPVIGTQRVGSAR